MFEGILPIYKERGITSHDVVFRARRILQMKKIGHSGTLDPEVDGVLLLLLGGATKVSDYAMDLGKSYRAEVCLGIKTTTEDLTGEVVEECKVTDISVDKIKEILKSMIGEIEQKPPIYSAIKVNGRKLYEYARRGQFDVEIPTRKVNIYNISFIENSEYYKDDKFYFSIDINCGKGTYVRTIATSIGEKLNLPSTMSKLTRTRSGKITLDNCLTLSEVEQHLKDETLEEKLLRKEYALEEYKFVEIPKFRAKQVMNGLRFRRNQFPDHDFTDGIVFTYENEAIAIYYLEDKDDELLSVKTTFPKIIE
ncbi:tRNA pseudouridine(55) synthase TruB [Gemella haemolysans]|uniref:tRNA pseudouridine(55) synthase TruB n=1 Tax=Gemella haemolysans TaxID=1379 RepID=UPI00195CF31C|nr:tRNA pseudouridine(55) synthase TruB [Gemella haemolysans]VTX82278.1 tRNA pseudouridine synthase B [Gemella haemolysans]